MFFLDKLSLRTQLVLMNLPLIVIGLVITWIGSGYYLGQHTTEFFFAQVAAFTSSAARVGAFGTSTVRGGSVGASAVDKHFHLMASHK